MDELVGASVFDQDGRTSRHGVPRLSPIPASDLLELEGGGLIPLVFVVDQAPGRIIVDIPEGTDRVKALPQCA